MSSVSSNLYFCSLKFNYCKCWKINNWWTSPDFKDQCEAWTLVLSSTVHEEMTTGLPLRSKRCNCTTIYNLGAKYKIWLRLYLWYTRDDKTMGLHRGVVNTGKYTRGTSYKLVDFLPWNVVVRYSPMCLVESSSCLWSLLAMLRTLDQSESLCTIASWLGFILWESLYGDVWSTVWLKTYVRIYVCDLGVCPGPSRHLIRFVEQL